MRYLLILLSLIFSGVAFSVSPINSYDLFGAGKIYEYHQERSDRSERLIYSTWDGKDQNKKYILLYLQGSGCESLIRKKKNKIYSGNLDELISVFSKDYWVFAFEKRGVAPFSGYNDKEKCSEEYNRYITWEYRTKETEDVLEFVRKLKVVNTKRVVVLGYSEGTDVVLGTILSSKIPTHAGYFVGGGTTQMFDLIVLARKFYFKDISDPAKKERKIEEYFSIYEDIINNPESTDKYFMGHSYQRWASFFKNEPDKLFLKVDIPVFLAHGTRDESSPIESVDFLQTQMILHNKKNITFRKYPGLNHYLADCDQTDKKCMKDKKKFKRAGVFKEFLKWLEETGN